MAYYKKWKPSKTQAREMEQYFLTYEQQDSILIKQITTPLFDKETAVAEYSKIISNKSNSNIKLYCKANGTSVLVMHSK